MRTKTHTDKNTAFCTSRVASRVSQNQFRYNCTQNHKCIHNQLTVQVYTKPVYYTSVHKTSLPYKCTQNQFNVQVYTKPVYFTSVHKTSLLKQCTKNQITVQVYTKAVYYTSIHKTSLLSGHKTSLLCKCTKRLDRDRQTDFNFSDERNVQGRNIT